MYLEYPKIIALEVTNHCFMKCIHCPHGHGRIRDKGFMSWELFTSVMEDIESWRYDAERTPEIVLYGNGEPLLHKRIADFTAYCHDRGYNTNLSTNILLATAKQARALSDAGLDLIKLSFWGDNKQEYEARTPRQTFERAIEKAKAFIENTSPEVKVVVNIVKYRGLNQSLTPSPEFTRHFEDYPNVSFYCFFGSDWRGTLDIPELKVPLLGDPNPAPCKMAGEMIPISWEGKVVFCWIDYNREFVLGDYYPGSLLKYWRSRERLDRLDMMSQGRFREMELCRNCSAPYSERSKPRYYREGDHEETVVGKHLYEPDFIDDPAGEAGRQGA